MLSWHPLGSFVPVDAASVGRQEGAAGVERGRRRREGGMRSGTLGRVNGSLVNLRDYTLLRRSARRCVEDRTARCAAAVEA